MITVNVGKQNPCTNAAISVTQVNDPNRVYDLNEPALFRPSDFFTWTSSSTECPVQHLIITTEYPTGRLFGETQYSDASYDGYSSLEVPMPTFMPGCFTGYAYAATAGSVGGIAKAEFCTCGNEEMIVNVPSYSVSLNQTTTGTKVRNPSNMTTDGKYSFMADANTVTFNYANRNSSEQCGVKSMTLYQDTAGTLYTGQQISFDPTTLTTTIDTSQPLETDVYLGLTSRGGVTKYIRGSILVKAVKSYSYCDISSI